MLLPARSGLKSGAERGLTRGKSEFDFDDERCAQAFFFFFLGLLLSTSTSTLLSLFFHKKKQMAFMAEDTTVTIVPNFSLPAATGGFIRCIAVSSRRFFRSLFFFFTCLVFLNSLSRSPPLRLPLPLPSPPSFPPGLLRPLLAQPPRRRAPLARPRPPRHEEVPPLTSRLAVPGVARRCRRGREGLGLEVRAAARGVFGGREAAADQVPRGV